MTQYHIWRNGNDRVVVTEYLPIPKVGGIEWRVHDYDCSSIAAALNRVIANWERTGVPFALATEAIPESRKGRMQPLLDEEQTLVDRVVKTYQTLTEVRRLVEKKYEAK